MSHRAVTRAARCVPAPRIERDERIVASCLDDAAHVPGGHAMGVAFPDSEAEVAALVAGARCVLPVGAQSSLTGGATPRGDVVLSTRALRGIDLGPSGVVRVGAGVSLAELQGTLAAAGLYYPPVPTYDGAFVGGTIATNAAGAATFKYGPTRPWVTALTVVLAGGNVLDITRGETHAEHGVFDIVHVDGCVATVPVPTYRMPDVAKLSAGYYACPGMDLIDLFIGSEGTLGVIVAATLRVVARPLQVLAFVACADDAQAVALTLALRRAAVDAWAGRGPLDVAAIEYIDAHALALLPDDVFVRASLRRPPPGSVVLLVRLDVSGEVDAALAQFSGVLEHAGVDGDPVVTLPDDDRGTQRLVALREAVPAAVNAFVASVKARHPDVEKTACDMVVPVHRLLDSIALYRRAFSERGLRYAIWGHLSDGNLHPNLLPRSREDVRLGREAILEIGHAVQAMGGAPLAEHGVGRSLVKQQLLRELYGEEGLEQMRAVKRALDPEWTLAPGVLFPRA